MARFTTLRVASTVVVTVTRGPAYAGASCLSHIHPCFPSSHLSDPIERASD